MPRPARDDILRAFDLKPWHIGLAPVPLRVRIWHRITLARWRGQRAIARDRRFAR